MSLHSAWSPQLPPLNDFILSPGFGGGLVLLAALIVLLAGSRRGALRLDQQLGQQDRHHKQIRADGQRREAIERCWQRLLWLVNTASMESEDRYGGKAGMGLGPELALAILEGLNREAHELDDDPLAKATAVYLRQYGLVLGQRIGSLPDVLDSSDKRPERAASGIGRNRARQEADTANSAAANAGTPSGGEA